MIYDYTKEFDEQVVLDECYFNFDLERMKEAVESPAIELPKNLTREEMRLFILNAKFEE